MLSIKLVLYYSRNDQQSLVRQHVSGNTQSPWLQENHTDNRHSPRRDADQTPQQSSKANEESTSGSAQPQRPH